MWVALDGEKLVSQPSLAAPLDVFAALDAVPFSEVRHSPEVSQANDATSPEPSALIRTSEIPLGVLPFAALPVGVPPHGVLPFGVLPVEVLPVRVLPVGLLPLWGPTRLWGVRWSFAFQRDVWHHTPL